jgi:hypothetical protein
VLKNQRKVLKKRAGSVTFWAWMVSIVFHLFILTAFGFVKLSHSTNSTLLQYIPTANIRRPEHVMANTAIMPKPKVKKSARDKKVDIREQTTIRSSFSVPDSETLNGSLRPSNVLHVPDDSLAEKKFAGGVEFYGNKTYERKICYIVDCSGSMQGLMDQVRQRLKDSIEDLVPDQFFYVIFFGGGELFELGDGKLVRASQRNKENAYDFIDTIRAAGRTNAYKALERATQVEDSFSNKASVFYFLTDGFELSSDESEDFYKKTFELVKRYAPDSKVNTIGFWSTDQDCSILRAISSLSGGKCVIIADGDF